MEVLEQKLNYKFNNKKLLQNALTHSSYANEVRNGLTSNERLEFLGDSVLSIIVAEYLFLHYKSISESFAKSSIVIFSARIVFESPASSRADATTSFLRPNPELMEFSAVFRRCKNDALTTLKKFSSLFTSTRGVFLTVS